MLHTSPGKLGRVAGVVGVVGIWAVLSACTPGRQQGGECPPKCGNPDGGSTAALTLTPGVVTLVVDGAPAQQQFTAKDKLGADVTQKATWTVGPNGFATVTSGLVTTSWPLPSGVVATVTANYNNAVGSATIIMVYKAPPVVHPSAPNDAPGSFGGPASTDSTLVARTVYPFDGTMLARNILQMNLQWSAGSAAKIHRIRAVGEAIDASFYVGAAVCKNGTQCQYKFADKDWQMIAHSALGKPVAITISGTAASGQPVGTSTPTSLRFSPDDTKGGLYYFSTSTRGLKRLPIGASQATDFIVNGNQTGCVGCHAISRDGKKVAATFGGGDGYAGMVDGADGKKYILPPDTQQNKYPFNFSTFSPDGKRLITNWAGRLYLRNGDTGQLIMEIPQQFYGAKQAVMPEWSRDGEKIVFVGIPQEGFIGKDMSSFLKAGDWILGNGGSIMVMPYNNGAFGQAQVVVPSMAQKEYHFYPSISPDSKWIVFATGTYPGSSPTAALNGVTTTGKCMSYDQDTARLRLVQITGGPVIELTNATHAMNRTSSWPKFTPFLQDGGKLVFFTFSSKFNYGFIVPDKARPQIWMAAIDLGRAASELGTTDPSYPPFWLPFQDATQNNHSTTWTDDVVCVGAGGGECPPEFTCENGTCVPIVG